MRGYLKPEDQMTPQRRGYKDEEHKEGDQEVSPGALTTALQINY